MDKNSAAFWMTLLGTACWAVCFWWMYRISEKQNHLLDRLTEQGKRIEKLSKIEHDLIKDEVIAAVKENTESNHHPVTGHKKG
jgi:hypothetical protein